MGTKEKFWFAHHDQRWWLFKFNRTGHGDDWSEKVASEIAGLLGLPHAHVELATFENRPGIIALDFTRRGALTLVHGNELLTMLVDPKYPKGQNYHVSEHTVQRALVVLKDFRRPTGFSAVEEIKDAADVFAGYLMLDALVGNTDRHHENWAVLVCRRQVEGVEKGIELAPTFDHASCLGFNLSDAERVDRMTLGRNRSVSGFAARARSKLYRQVGDSKPLSPLEAFSEATMERRPARTAWISRLRSISDESLRLPVDRIPPERASLAARDFAHNLLCHNRARLLELE
jgi:hypothetical protein